MSRWRVLLLGILAHNLLRFFLCFSLGCIAAPVGHGGSANSKSFLSRLKSGGRR